MISKPKLVKRLEINEDTITFEGSTSRIYFDIIPSFQKLPNYNPTGINDNFLANIAEKTIDIHYKAINKPTASDTTLQKNDSTGNDSIINASTVSIPINSVPVIPQGFEGKPREADANDGTFLY
ncbi:MAG: hypothetical protein HC905_08710 [Bacteroidales bacterium]|nr:hypothetical protein [Bacteroidales bacterium]